MWSPVSTAALKKTYDHLNADVRVIPNALPFDYLGKPHDGPTKNAVLWRGEGTVTGWI